MKIVQELGLRQEEAFIHHSIGTVYFLLSDNKNALSFYKQALTIWEKLNQPVDKAAVQYSIGQLTPMLVNTTQHWNIIRKQN